MKIEEILFVIFSYNRGKYLKNCVDSIFENCPGIKNENIMIYDDHSDDPKTVDILDALQQKIKVNINKGKNPAISRRGLYHNMNKALQDAIKGRFNYIFFIQEDLQFVRELDSRFLSECQKILESDPNIIQIQPLFFKGTIKEKEYSQFLKMNEEFQYYYGNPHQLYGIADIGLTKVEPLRVDDWQFDHEETINMKKGTQKGWLYVKPKNPIMMYLPWPETYRYKKTGKDHLFTRLLDYYYKTGFYPYKKMTDDVVQVLLDRPIQEYPYGERFLKLKLNVKLREPWNYVSAKFYFLKRFFKVSKKVHLFWIIEVYYKVKFKSQVKRKTL